MSKTHLAPNAADLNDQLSLLATMATGTCGERAATSLALRCARLSVRERNSLTATTLALVAKVLA